MLQRIHIKHFALAENLSIDFRSGLNILTGETGAGKSILVGAISAVLGGRTYTEVIRTGFERASVEAVFTIGGRSDIHSLLEEHGLEHSDELILRREISEKTSARAFVNDSVVTVATLAKIGDLLVDIHGQHQHQSLLRRDTHRHFLDAFGKLNNDLEQTARACAAVREAAGRITDLQRRHQEAGSRHELYSFQAKEIGSVNPQAEEEEGLLQEARVLGNMEKLFTVSARLEELFNGEGANLLSMSNEAVQRLQDIGAIVPDIARLAADFASARIVIDETARNIEEFKSNLEFDPQRLEEVEERLNALSQLKKKYGGTVAAVLEHYQEITAALQLQENVDFELQSLRKQYNARKQGYGKAAHSLSAARKQVAAQMEQQVSEQLQQLGMPDFRFQVNFELREENDGIFEQGGKAFFGDESGCDQIEFFISPNPGESFKPLSKIASGGEMSRIMLSLKNLLAEGDQIPTLIFDEVDAGVSGRIAQAVGRSIARLAENHQILCITHLPQIAAYGSTHFGVVKEVREDRTFTRITPLSNEERVEAIARLIGGEHISETVLASARQLIAEGQEEA